MLIERTDKGFPPSGEREGGFLPTPQATNGTGTGLTHCIGLVRECRP